MEIFAIWPKSKFCEDFDRSRDFRYIWPNFVVLKNLRFSKFLIEIFRQFWINSKFLTEIEVFPNFRFFEILDGNRDFRNLDRNQDFRNFWLKEKFLIFSKELENLRKFWPKSRFSKFRPKSRFSKFLTEIEIMTEIEIFDVFDRIRNFSKFWTKSRFSKFEAEIENFWKF